MVVMMSTKLLAISVLLGGGYLIAVSVIFNLIERRLRLLAGVPADMIETESSAWLLMTFLSELIFYVIIPAIGYGMFYAILPFSGVRAGLAGTLLAFLLGAVPVMMRLSMRIRLPMPYLLFQLLGH